MIVLIAVFFYLYPELVVGSDEQGDFANLGGRMKFSLGREGSFALGPANFSSVASILPFWIRAANA